MLVLIQVVGAAIPQNCSLRSRFCWKPQPRSAADKPTRFERKKPINATSVATKGEVAAKPLGASSPFSCAKRSAANYIGCFFRTTKATPDSLVTNRRYSALPAGHYSLRRTLSCNGLLLLLSAWNRIASFPYRKDCRYSACLSL